MNPSPYITLAVFAVAFALALAGNLLFEGLARCIERRRRERRERNCGRYVCAWCMPQRDLGPAWKLPAGETSHGICGECRALHFEHSPKLCGGAGSAGPGRTGTPRAEARAATI